MQLHTADLAHASSEMTLDAPGIVPIPDAVLPESGPRQRPGFWPTAAVVIALAATLVWNGFILWECAMLLLGWIGLT